MEVELPHHSLDVDPDGRPKSVSDVHGVWLVASQDCELAWIDAAREECCVEIRPVFSENPPAEWGIRSSRLLVTESLYLDAQSPRPMASPRLLSELSDSVHVLCLTPDAARAVKTWLGRRYDRPAVPGRYVELHKLLQGQITRKSRKHLAWHVRDVMVRYDSTEAGLTTFELVAVLPRSSSSAGSEASAIVESIEEWLAEVALAIPQHVGIASKVLAQPADGVSIAFLEDAYAIDASDVSWPRKGGGPVGATS